MTTSQFKTISEIISLDSIRVVSFDIFDTLLVRPGMNPTDVFHLLEAEAQRVLGKVDFLKIRSSAENDMNQAMTEVQARENHSLSDIYQHIATSYKFDAQSCLELCACEGEIERRVLRAREDVRRLYELAKEKNKRIIAVSDMYFSSSFLREVLELKGFEHIASIYVSSECKKRKDRGDLFPFVLRCEEITADQMVHIGDNFVSDVVRPFDCGIIGLHCEKTLDVLAKSDSLFAPLVNGYDSADVSSKLVIGLALESWFSKNGDGTSKGLIFNGDLEMFGYLGLGPFLFYLANEIASDSSIQGAYDGVNFASRDGYLVKCAYDLLSRERSLLPSNYVYSGRIAYDLYRFQGDVYDYLSQTRLRDERYTLRALLESSIGGWAPDLLEEILSELKSAALDSPYSGQDILLRQICAKWQEPLAEVFRHGKSLSSSYYKENLKANNENRAIIFDVGYSGSVSKAIGALTGSVVDKIYLHENQTNVTLDDEAGTKTWKLLQDEYGFQKELPGFYLIFEELFSASEGTCVSFRSRPNGRVEARLDSLGLHAAKLRSDLQAIQRGALRFVELAADVFGRYVNVIRSSNPKALVDLVFYTFARSRTNEERMFRNICFADNFFHFESTSLAMKISGSRLTNSNLKRSGFNNSTRYSANDEIFPLVKNLPSVGIYVHLYSAYAIVIALKYLRRLTLRFDLIVIIADLTHEAAVRKLVQRDSVPSVLDVHVHVVSPKTPEILSWIEACQNHRNAYDIIGHFHFRCGSSDQDEARKDENDMEILFDPGELAGLIAGFQGDNEWGLCFPPAQFQRRDGQKWIESRRLSRESLEFMEIVLGRMDLDFPLVEDDICFPPRNLFWCRSVAVSRLLELNLASEFALRSGVRDLEQLDDAMCRLLHVVSTHCGFRTFFVCSRAQLIAEYLSGGGGLSSPRAPLEDLNVLSGQNAELEVRYRKVSTERDKLRSDLESAYQNVFLKLVKKIVRLLRRVLESNEK